MALQKLDLRNYVPMQSALVPDGEYLARVTKIITGVSPKKKTPQWTIYLEILEGEERGEIIQDRAYPTPAAMFTVTRFLNAVGVKTPPGSQITVDTDRLVGRKVRVVTVTEEYNGERSSRPTRYLAVKNLPTAQTSDYETIDIDLEEETPAPAPASENPKKKSKKSKKEKKADVDWDGGAGIDLSDLNL